MLKKSAAWIGWALSLLLLAYDWGVRGLGWLAGPSDFAHYVATPWRDYVWPLLRDQVLPVLTWEGALFTVASITLAWVYFGDRMRAIFSRQRTSASQLSPEERRTDSWHDVEPMSGSNLKPPVPAALPAAPAKIEAVEMIRPLSETIEDKQAKHDLAIFITDHVIPTYTATITLQEAIVRTICGRYTVIAELAWKAFQNEENMWQYILYINRLKRATKQDIADIPLGQLVDSVYAVSELHHALCSFNSWLAFVRHGGSAEIPFDYKSNEATAELYRHWRERQDALVAAFQPFRRDIRFPRFYNLSGKRGLGHSFETDA